MYVFPALYCTQCTSVVIFHITSLAATGELPAAQTALLLRPLGTATTASDLMRHIEQNGGKLLAKIKFFCKWFLLSVPKSTSLLCNP